MPQNNETPLVPNEDSPNTSGGLLGDILASEEPQVDLLSESFIDDMALPVE